MTYDFSSHPLMVAALSSAATWLFNNVVTVMITSLPAPTRNSSAKYTYWFKVLNTIIGNLQRAKSTAIERSPNWQDAVDQHVQTIQSNGLSSISTSASNSGVTNG